MRNEEEKHARREGEGGSRRTKVEEGSGEVEKVEGALTDAWSSAMDNAMDDGRRRPTGNDVDWFSRPGMPPHYRYVADLARTDT